MEWVDKTKIVLFIQCLKQNFHAHRERNNGSFISSGNSFQDFE